MLAFPYANITNIYCNNTKYLNCSALCSAIWQNCNILYVAEFSWHIIAFSLKDLWLLLLICFWQALVILIFCHDFLWIPYAFLKCFQVTYYYFTVFFLPLANLTGHTERVGMENFELLKVLGTGGKHLNLTLNKHRYNCQSRIKPE